MIYSSILFEPTNSSRIVLPTLTNYATQWNVIMYIKKQAQRYKLTRQGLTQQPEVCLEELCTSPKEKFTAKRRCVCKVGGNYTISSCILVHRLTTA